MKICFAIEKFDPRTGGAERYIWDLVHFLACRGHDVAVICIKAASNAETRIRIEKVPVIRFPQGLRHLSFAVMHYLKARSMKDYIHYCVGNTCYADVYQPHGGIHKAWFLEETRIYPDWTRDFVRFARRCSLKDIVQRSLEWMTLRISRPLFIAISEKVKRDVSLWFGYLEDRIRLFPNGIDTKRFNPSNRRFRSDIRKELGIAEDEIVFLFVAQNLKLKGYSVLEEACRKNLSDMKFKVLVIGPADKGLIAKAPGNFIFTGVRYDLEKIYPACDCLVHPTYYDACSLVVLEALASGIPVITTISNGAAMFVGMNGFVVPSGNPGELAASMRAILDGKRMGLSGTVFKNSSDVFSEIEALLNEFKTE
jgi:UDP-glucose:(heptosyl)LPS alpha-1,3-glucosyltransferase